MDRKELVVRLKKVISGDVLTINVLGTHISLLDDPHVQVLAARLLMLLSAGERQSSSLAEQ